MTGILDAFDREDGPLAGSSTDTGQTWVDVWGSGWAITGNKVGGSPTSPYRFGFTGVPVADTGPITVEADITAPTGSGIGGLHIGTLADPAGYSVFVQSGILYGGAPSLWWVKTDSIGDIAGSGTITTPTIDAGSTHRYGLSMDPATNILTVTMDGTEVYSATKDALPAQPWAAGVTCWTGYLNTTRIDNFAVNDAGGGPAPDPEHITLGGAATFAVQGQSATLHTAHNVTLGGAASLSIRGAGAALAIHGHTSLGGAASFAVQGRPAVLHALERTHLGEWTGDQSQRANFEFGGDLAPLNIVPAIVPPPVGGPVPPTRVITRRSVVMPEPTDGPFGRPEQPWVPDEVISGDVGRYRICVAGKDVTFFRGTDTIVEEHSTAEAFGPDTAVILVSGISPFETFHEGELWWIRDHASVEIDLVLTNGNLVRVWEGWVASHEDSIDETTMQVRLQCKGVMLQADHILKQPDWDKEPKDVGTLLAYFFNRIQARRYARLDPVNTGIKVTVPGSWQPVTDWADEVLALATTDDGLNQWTVECNKGRAPKIRLKDMDTVHWTVDLGAPGVAVNVSRDITQAPAAIYGSGTDEKGRYYSNQRFPNMSTGPVPPYLFADLSRVAHVGDSDGDTGDGHGITEIQRQLRQQGYKTPVTGNFTTETAAAVRRAQKDMGLTIDGQIGPQTFSALYDVGSLDAADFKGAHHAPLAYDPRVEKHTFTASGAIKGDNPYFNPEVIRIEQFQQMPDGTSKEQAIRSTEAQITENPGYVGTITLRTDPHEGSKVRIRAGQNIILRFHRDRVFGRKFHIAHAQHAQGTVTLTVDTKGRDYLTLVEIIKRNKDAVGPARKKRRKKSDMVSTRPAFDSESPAGKIRRHPVNGDAGLWTVIRVPLGWTGSVVKLRYQTTNPASKFALAVFTQKVTAADLARLVGNPLVQRDDFYEPFSKNAKELDELGMQYAVGGPYQPAGYWPGQATAWNGDNTGHPVTGEFRDDAGFSFDTTEGTPPYIYVAEFTDASCYIEGEFFVAPGEF